MDRSEASYDEFLDMARQAYNTYTTTINDYITDLETRGEANLTEITESLREFQRQSQNAFNEWFAYVQGLLDEDIAGRLINLTTNHEERLSIVEYMNIHDDYFAPLMDDEGRVILDDNDNAIMVDWKYKYA